MLSRMMRQSDKMPLVLGRAEAAAALRISLRKLDYLIQRGEIAPVRIDGRVLVAYTELLRFVEANTVTAADRQPSRERPA